MRALPRTEKQPIAKLGKEIKEDEGLATKLKVIGSFLLYVNDGYKRELRFFIETLRKVKCTVSRSPIGHRRGDCLSGKK